MPRIDLSEEERVKLLNKAASCLIDPKNNSVPIATETVLLALHIVVNLHTKLVDADEKKSVREIYLDSGAFDENGDVTPF